MSFLSSRKQESERPARPALFVVGDGFNFDLELIQRALKHEFCRLRSRRHENGLDFEQTGTVQDWELVQGSVVCSGNIKLLDDWLPGILILRTTNRRSIPNITTHTQS